MKTALFMPLVNVREDGEIDTEWFQSLDHVFVDDTGETIDDDEGGWASDQLDLRLENIRALLNNEIIDGYYLADLIRPFFERKDTPNG